MSQATTWGVPRNSAEGDLSEDAWAAQADEVFDAILSQHKGSIAPAYAGAGTRWIDDSATPWAVKDYDGTDWITVMEIDPATNSIRWRSYKGADIASAAALAPGGDGNYFDVTGTTTITSINSIGVGTMIRLHFDAALTLTHHSTDLVLPGGANITTAAGDEAEFIEYASGDWRCVSYQVGGTAPGAIRQFGASLDASVASNALTVTLKNLNGDDPSAAAPASLRFRDATLANGGYSQVDVTAATSLVISSGSTMGAASNTPFRLWIVAINDGGTVRLGAINCSDSGAIYPLAEWGLVSSTAEGGAGAADAAGTIYSGTAATSKSMIILGFMTWESGLTTAGTWDATPTVIQLFGPGVPKPGDTIQSKTEESTTTTNVTSNAYTTTSLSVSLSPKSAANLVGIIAAGSMIINTQGKEGQAIIQRGGASIGTARAAFNVTGGVEKWPMLNNVTDKPGTTASTTYAVAISNDDNSTLIQFPGAQGQSEGGSITATEIMG